MIMSVSITGLNRIRKKIIKLTQTYRDYINRIIKPRFNVQFVHTPGHSGIAGNELVDRLAGSAIDNFVKDKLVR